MSICVKRREAPIDYTIDWGRAWMGTAEILSSHWTVEGDRPIDLAAVPAPAAQGLSRATLSGGLAGGRYTVRGHVVLSDGRAATRSLRLQIGTGR